MDTGLLRRSMPSEMAELNLLLPRWQMAELADAADAQGMTVGQLMRGLIQQILHPFSEKEGKMSLPFDSHSNAN